MVLEGLVAVLEEQLGVKITQELCLLSSTGKALRAQAMHHQQEQEQEQEEVWMEEMRMLLLPCLWRWAHLLPLHLDLLVWMESSAGLLSIMRQINVAHVHALIGDVMAALPVALVLLLLLQDRLTLLQLQLQFSLSGKIDGFGWRVTQRAF